MIRTDWQDWKRWSRKYTMLPYIYEAEWKGLPLSWEAFWEQAGPYSFVLESGRSGRYTYMGLLPAAYICGCGEEAVEYVLVDRDEVQEALSDVAADLVAVRYEPARRMQGPPLDILRDWMAEYRSPLPEDMACYTGGCVGYLGYDSLPMTKQPPSCTEADPDVPDYLFMLFDRIWVYDHECEKLSVCVHIDISREMSDQGVDETKLLEAYRRAARTAENLADMWRICAEKAAASGRKRRAVFDQLAKAEDWNTHGKTDPPETNMSKEQFTAAVRRVQDYIHAGEVLQVNLSLRQKRKVDLAPEILYEWLRLLNPSPYMGLLRLGEFQLVSGSPELLIKLSGDRLRTRPIGGTRRRGRTEEEDRALEQELLMNAKERNEHKMLVDVEYADLSRVAEHGTVSVDQFMVIERYSHVMHLVSDLSAKLRQGLDAYDVLEAVFPGGTITGAPKRRTMEIIEELEPTRRGVYTGSFGWIDYKGNMEFNIIIRTMLVRGGTAYVQAGAGIVSESVPEREYQESLNKAQALWQAVHYAESAEKGSPT